MALKKEVIYTLPEGSEFEYGKAGNLQTCAFITLLPPTSRNMEECAFLKQAFFQAVRDQQDRSGGKDDDDDDDEKEEDDDSTLSGDTIVGILLVSNVNFNTILIAAKTLFTSGIGRVDGEAKLTCPLIEKLSMDELEEMMGLYMSTFILASALQKQKKR